MNARRWIVISGFSWLGIGALLLFKGLKWIVQAMTASEAAPLVKWCSSIAGTTEQGALLLICLALFIGFIKGRMVLSKTVERIVTRLKSLPLPIQLSQAYDRLYLIILGSMMALGLLFRFLPLSLDIRGAIDVAIGSALMNGAMLYFREAVTVRKT